MRNMADGVPEAKGTSEMRRVLKSLTDNNTRFIIDNGRAYVSQHQKANAFMNMHKLVSSLKLTKEDRGEKRILNRMLWTLEVAKGTWEASPPARSERTSIPQSIKGCRPRQSPSKIPSSFGLPGGFVPNNGFCFNKSWTSKSIP